VLKASIIMRIIKWATHKYKTH